LRGKFDFISDSTDIAELMTLTSGIGKKLKRENNLDYAPNQIIVQGIPELLRPLYYWRPSFVGVVLVAVVLIFPQGIYPGLKRLVSPTVQE
jgi:hypothetical protein